MKILFGLLFVTSLFNTAIFALDGSTHGKEQSHHHARKANPLSGKESAKKLEAGNLQFVQGNVHKHFAVKKIRSKLATGQTPHAIVLSCSDSRVPPEHVFNQNLGEIFVVRTAGQSLDSMAIGSIEYALAHLGSNLIVVLGHESCGAVKAALDTLKGGDAGSKWLNNLVHDIHPHVKMFSDLPRSKNLHVESWANVRGVADDLVSRSEIVSALVKSGEVEIKKGLYSLETGKVEWEAL